MNLLISVSVATTRRRAHKSDNCCLLWAQSPATYSQKRRIWRNQCSSFTFTRVGSLTWDFAPSSAHGTSFRGPAPLHHTLLAGETHTGVTLQTLHPEKFDHGAILAQTPPLEIPNAAQCTYEELLDFITPKAAEILAQGIRNRLFLSDPMCASSSTENGRPLRHAPKITTQDRHIDWAKWTTEDFLRRDRVLGRLWSLSQPRGKPETRLIFDGLEDLTAEVHGLWWFEKLKERAGIASFQPAGGVKIQTSHRDPGNFFLLPLIPADSQRLSIPCVKHGDALIMRHPNGDALLVREITVEGGRKKPAAKALEDWSRTGEIEAISLV